MQIIEDIIFEMRMHNFNKIKIKVLVNFEVLCLYTIYEINKFLSHSIRY